MAGKSALDHIHNVVSDESYKKGYADGQKNSIPIDWLKAEATIARATGDKAGGFKALIIDWLIAKYTEYWPAKEE